MKYASIIFLNEYDDETAEIFLNGDLSENLMIEHLSQWDYGEYHDTMESEPWGSCDTVYKQENSDYILSYNTGLGYVSLAVKLED